MRKFAIDITLRDKDNFKYLAFEGRTIGFEAETYSDALAIWARGRDAILDRVDQMEKKGQENHEDDQG